MRLPAELLLAVAILGLSFCVGLKPKVETLPALIVERHARRTITGEPRYSFHVQFRDERDVSVTLEMPVTEIEWRRYANAVEICLTPGTLRIRDCG